MESCDSDLRERTTDPEQGSVTRKLKQRFAEKGRLHKCRRNGNLAAGGASMLSQEQLNELTERLKLSESTCKIIDHIRASPPQRRVQGRAGNVVTRYPSRKMGVTIQAESHQVELAAVHWMEYDEVVLEYYDQPPSICLGYISKQGKTVTVWHTPDFLVIRKEWIGWEEWKTEGQLAKLSESMPNRYQRDEEGRWRCPPGESYAKAVGLAYRVRSSGEINWVFERNFQFLEDYWQAKALAVSPAIQTKIRRRVSEQSVSTLSELLAYVKAEGWNADNLYGLIAQGELYVDLSVELLAEPERVHIFCDRQTDRAYRFALSANTRSTATPTISATAAGPAAEILKRLNAASPMALHDATRRYHWLKDGGQGVSERTLRHWRRAYAQAEQEYGNGFVGLLSKTALCGNRKARLSESVQTLMNSIIAEHYETPTNKTMRVVYGELLQTCHQQELTAPSYKTFTIAVARRPKVQQLERREGARAAYQQQSFYWALECATPRHGDRPFEIGHIDHTELDIELVCSRTGQSLGRPWLTLLMDANTRRVLAVYLSYQSPSHRSCMMILRECVRRYQRLPQTLIVDGGAEFESEYFETLLALYGVSKKSRPGASPRFGSVCERLFGTTNTMFVHNLQGNTQVMSNTRQVTPIVSPARLATWTLSQLHESLSSWTHELYDQLDHPALGQSPRQAWEEGITRTGSRAHRSIAYDETFIMATLPAAPRKIALVRGMRGIQVNRIAYWTDDFRDPDVDGQRVSVRYDPFDASVVFAYVKQHWARCISEHYAQFQGRSSQEINLISEEVNRRGRLHDQKFNATSAQIAAFIRSAESTLVIAKQQAQDLEDRRIHGQMNAIASAPWPNELNTPPSVMITPELAATQTVPETLVVYGDY